MTLFSEHDLAQVSRIPAKQIALLTALADTGCGRQALAVLLDMLGKFHRDHIRYLTGPIIQHASPWAESTPPWLYQAVAGDRLRIILDEHERGVVGWQVGPAELTAVMYPATMDAPMQHDYAQIYLWAAARANARHYRKPVADIWSNVGEPVDDDAVEDSAGRYHYAYRHLCSDIRSRVVKRASAGTPPCRKTLHDPAKGVEQLPLF